MPTALILGASGRIGRHSAVAFRKAGWTVRTFDRARDDLTTSATGCHVIVNGWNPPNYHNWAQLVPQMTTDILAAAKASGAAVIIPGNVYHFGDTPGIWSEATPAKPVSRKGKIRLDMERAFAASGVQTIVLRAGNFIDPDRQGCILSALYLRQLNKRVLDLPGPPSVRQAFCYVPDWARAAVALAERRNSLARFEDIPFPGHTLTANDLQTQAQDITGADFRTARFPWWFIRLAAPFSEMYRELFEMRYLWQTDHALDGAKFAKLLPDFQATPIDQALRTYLAEGSQPHMRPAQNTQVGGTA
ncbi:MAG: NAD-dependent epimerase/dehydratase family protein [Pseudomonadota bacterium]